MAYSNKTICNPHTGQSIRFLQTAADTGGQLLEMETGYAPGSHRPPAHYHPQQTECFTVLEGAVQVYINGSLQKLVKGAQLVIHPNTVHAMWNPFFENAVVNWKVKPALTTEYLLETGMGMAADGKIGANGTPSLLQTALLMRHYRGVFRLAKPAYPLQQFVFGLLAPIALLAGKRAVYPQYIH